MAVFQYLYRAPTVGTSIIFHIEPRNSYNHRDCNFELTYYMSG